MTRNVLLLLLMLAAMASNGNASVRIKFTKIVCNLSNLAFGHGNGCILKAVSRNVQYLKMSYTVTDLPITDYVIRVQIMKRLNGWKPFLYDVTVDCTNIRRLTKLTKFVWPYINKLSNMYPHNCPFNQSIFEAKRIENTYMEKALELLPVPLGDYGVFVTVHANKKDIGQTNVFATVF